VSQARSRPRFEGLTVAPDPSGRCNIGVTLEWRGRTISRSVTCVETMQGRLRAAAQASLAAALEVVYDRASLSLIGVKAVRAFDGWVAIVRVNGEVGDRVLRLLGSAACEDEADLPRTAALALLNAINRALEQLAEGPALPFERATGLGSTNA
jgi:hypothetical protein